MDALALGWPARWLAGRYFNPRSWLLGQGAGSLSKQHRDGVRSAGALVLLTSPIQREEALLVGGQVYERFALKATQLGIANQPISAPIEQERFRIKLEQERLDKRLEQYLDSAAGGGIDREKLQSAAVAVASQQISLEEKLVEANRQARARESDEERHQADLPAVVQTDAASFEPLWHNPLLTLRNAFAQSLIGTVAEDDDGIMGYQLTTGHGQRAHLARLAVHPRIQGRGVGRLLLTDLFARLSGHGIGRLSVNTQNDNLASLRLYERMGFVRTGEQYPVYTFDIAGLSNHLPFDLIFCMARQGAVNRIKEQRWQRPMMQP